MLKYSLVENLLTQRADDYMAQSAQVRSFTIEEITELMLKRGTLLTKADILAVLEVYHQEIANIVADGDGVNTSVFHISPRIAGVFEGMNDGFDSSRHKIRLNLRAGTLLSEAKKKIRVEKVVGIDPLPLITQVTDIKSGSVNDLLTPNFNLRITGQKLKIVGDSDTVGVYFVNTDSHERVEVGTSDIVTNNPSELIVVIPSLSQGSYRLEITTRYCSSSTCLKEARTGIFSKVLIVQ